MFQCSVYIQCSVRNSAISVSKAKNIQSGPKFICSLNNNSEWHTLLLLFLIYYYMLYCIKSTFVVCISSRDHNENKVFLDLYYAIPATVFLDVLVMILL